MRREVLVVLPGLLLAIMLAMLDQLIVGTALPRIVGDLGGVAHLSWVVTAYVLASTITTPLYGKLGDMYGRKRLFITAIVIFLAGSALAGLSQTMAELIMFRAIQGLGAGGLMVSAIAIIGDLVSPRERGQYMGYIMAVMMIATIGGPLLGGWITDSFSWRWIFYINLPIGGAALAYLAATLKLSRRRVEHRVDYLGAVVLAIAATAIVLGATWGGTQYAWASPQIIGLIAVSVVAVAAFLVIESRAAEPILPLHIFRNRNFSLVTALSFLAGLSMFGAITFLPLYQQTVQGASPTISGLLLTPMMVGVMITSLIAGQITTRTGRYRALPILGSGGMALGMFLLSLLGVNTSRVTAGLYMVVLGLGMGFLMQMTTLLAQNSVQPTDIGVASSSPAVLPADRRVHRGSCVRRGLRPAAAGRAQLGLTGRAHLGQRRSVRPGHGHGAARRDPARRVLRDQPRGAGRVPVGDPRHRAGVPAVLVHQGGAAARPGRGAGTRAGARRLTRCPGVRQIAADPLNATRCTVLAGALCTAPRSMAGRGYPPT
jgi:EmrB/QacA subfamily drug resistance transporter